MAKLHIKKNDTVIVLAGADKGKTGKVLQVLKEKERAIVEAGEQEPKAFCQEPSGRHREAGSTHSYLEFKSG